MTDITIKYDHGQMLIHLDNFLSDRKISEVRKLIKLIRQSYWQWEIIAESIVLKSALLAK